MIKANDRFNKIRDLFKVKLYAIRSETEKKRARRLLDQISKCTESV